MSKRIVTGTTKQAKKTSGDKKKREKPPKLSEDEKAAKYGKNELVDYRLKFSPKNKKQEDLFNLIMEKQIVFVTGEAGSGKSFTCLSAALQLLKQDNTYKEIMIVVPTVESGNMKIGFLPGPIEDKILPYVEADYYTIEKILNLSGNNGKGALSKLIESGLITAQPISFMRGKTIDDKIVIISESENFSKQEMFLLLSRISDTSKYILNGDNKQIDRRDIHKEPNGLEYSEKRLKGNLDEVGFCHFNKEDIVRSKIISKIMDLWFDE